MVPRRIGLGFGVLVAALAGIGPTAHAAEPALVRVGVLGVMSDAGLYVAMEKGYFQEEGIRVDVQRFSAGAKMVPALVAGELEVAGGTAAAGLYNAIASGMDFKVVADKGQIRPGHEFTTLLVRRDLLDAGAFKSVADLKGRKIVHLPGQGVVTQYILGQTLEHAGIPWAGVDRVEIAAPNQAALLANKQADAAVTVEPFGARAERAGVGRRYPVSDEVIPMLIKHVRGATADDIKASWPPHLAPDGRPDVANLAAQQEWYLKVGMVEKKVPMETVVDLSFLP